MLRRRRSTAVVSLLLLTACGTNRVEVDPTPTSPTPLLSIVNIEHRHRPPPHKRRVVAPLPTTTTTRPHATATTTPPTAAPVIVPQFSSTGACGGDLPPCWIMQRESGGNIHAMNASGAAGKWQIMPGTWGGFGGYASAADAPEWVQDAKARTMALCNWQPPNYCAG